MTKAKETNGKTVDGGGEVSGGGVDDQLKNVFELGGEEKDKEEIKAANISFHDMCRMGDLDRVKEFLLQGVCTPDKNEKKQEIDKNHAAKVKDSDQMPSMLDSRDKHQRTPLHLAAYSGHAPVVEYLLQQGSNIHAQALDGMTALHFAVQTGHLDVVKKLLFFRANANSTLRKGKRSALHLACAKGYVDICGYLVRKGADPNCTNTREEKPIDLVRDAKLKAKMSVAIEGNLKLQQLSSSQRKYDRNKEKRANRRLAFLGEEDEDVGDGDSKGGSDSQTIEEKKTTNANDGNEVVIDTACRSTIWCEKLNDEPEGDGLTMGKSQNKRKLAVDTPENKNVCFGLSKDDKDASG